MSDVVAISPSTLIWLPWPNRIPLPLMSQIWPFAVRLPKICDESGPITRLTVIEPWLGCLNTTLEPAPMEKLSQSINALLVDCLTTVRADDGWVMRALPTTTLPPVGSAPCARASVPARQLVANSSPRRIRLDVLFMSRAPSEADRQVGQELCRGAAVVAAGHRLERARDFDVPIDVVRKPESEPRARG